MKFKKILFILTIFTLISNLFLANKVLAFSFWEENQDLVNQYEAARAEFREAMVAYEQARQNFLLAKEKFEAEKTAENKANLLTEAKNFLLKADIAIIKHLTMIKTKLNSVKGISPEEKAATLTEIESDINWLLAKQTEIKNAKTRIELSSLLKTIRDYWIGVRTKARRITGQIMAARVNVFLVKINEILLKTEKIINEAKAKGRDTTHLETWQNEAEEKYNLALERYKKAKETFGAIKTLKDTAVLFNQGISFIKEANQYLREAYADLKSILLEIKTR